MKFLALDFESGGIESKERGPVTLGLAHFDGGEVVKSKEWLFKPIRNWKGELQYNYTENAAQIHGKSLAMMEADGLDALTIYKEALEFMDGSWSNPIVSHKASFDADIWSNFMFAVSSYDRFLKLFIPAREILTGPWICTHRILSNRLSVPDDVPNFKLDTLCKFYGIGEQGEIHGSEADAILAGKLYMETRKCEPSPA